MNKKLKGIAMILFGILITQNPVTSTVWPYFMGVIFGLIGFLVVVWTKE